MENLLDHRLTTLMVVAQTGSLTAAAQQLFITQPAVSQQLASLEADLPRGRLPHEAERLVGSHSPSSPEEGPPKTNFVEKSG